jgi:hypothetical protein
MLPCTIRQPGQPETVGTIIQDLGNSFAVQVENAAQLIVPKLYVYPGTPKSNVNQNARCDAGINLLDASLRAAIGDLEKYQSAGATNFELRDAIAFAFGLGKGSNNPTWWYAKGGKSPKFWLKQSSSGKPDLTGKALIDKVRELYSIPFPENHPQSKEEALAHSEWKVGDRFVQYEGMGSLERFGTITELCPRRIGPNGDMWWEVYYGVQFDDERDGSSIGEVIDTYLKKTGKAMSHIDGLAYRQLLALGLPPAQARYLVNQQGG